MTITKTRPPPCPFCGKVSWRFYRDPGTWATQVECTACGARGPLCIPSEDAALAAWSERAAKIPTNDDTLCVAKPDQRDLAATLKEFVQRRPQAQTAVDEILVAEREGRQCKRSKP
jgi:hypothetical protein